MNSFHIFIFCVFTLSMVMELACFNEPKSQVDERLYSRTEKQRYDGWFNNLAHPEWGSVVIDLYRGQTCLWKTTDPDYQDKVKRNLAREKLVEVFKTVEPTVTKDTV